MVTATQESNVDDVPLRRGDVVDEALNPLLLIPTGELHLGDLLLDDGKLLRSADLISIGLVQKQPQKSQIQQSCLLDVGCSLDCAMERSEGTVV